MSPDLPTEVSVELDAAELGGPTEIGTLRRVSASGGGVVAFAYADAWLARPDAFVLDPSHGLYGGVQYPRAGHEIAPAFTDCSPDRWGRTLLDRREALRAREERRARRTLGEWGYLLGVNDRSRMGALRFRTAEGRYLDDDTTAIPPAASLRELEAAVRLLETPSRRGGPAEAHHLAILIAPGGSLGGARPKATFVDDDSALWIAKFPSRNDSHDVAQCEWVLNELAQAAGIEVPEHRLIKLGRRHHTFLARRFDRRPGTRRMYCSAMTMLAKRDREEASYLDIAMAIADYAAPGAVVAELAALFRRLVFNVLTSHRDDHLRNHGFLREFDGWHLSPAFDLNPVPDKIGHELSVEGSIHEVTIDLVIESAPFYRLSHVEATAAVDEVLSAIASWRETARTAGVRGAELDVLAAAIATGTRT